MIQQPISNSRSRQASRGAITLWLILLMPVLVILLLFVADIGQIWVARVELENAMEAASLAAVKEWGDNGGGSTWEPRKVGVTFAAANGVHDDPVEIHRNFNRHRRNGNASREGDLIFGAITSRHRPWVFNAKVLPGCEFGEILVDASGDDHLGGDNAWGVAFRARGEHRDDDDRGEDDDWDEEDDDWDDEDDDEDDEEVSQSRVAQVSIYREEDDDQDHGLLIQRITIDVDPRNRDIAHFVEHAVLSDNRPHPAVCDRRGNSQPDNFGWYNTPPSESSCGRPSKQIRFGFTKPSPSTGKPRMLVIEFQGHKSDEGFSPGDRFRFGAGVRVRKKNSQHFRTANGDDIGMLGAKVTVQMQSDGRDLPLIKGCMNDSGGRRRDCLDGRYITDPLGYKHLVVHPHRIADLPCPPGGSTHGHKNGQSRVLMGHRFRPYAVRAQATVKVSSLSCLFGDAVFGPYKVTACATAMYDCRSNRPRLIRVRPENFKCR